MKTQPVKLGRMSIGHVKDKLGQVKGKIGHVKGKIGQVKGKIGHVKDWSGKVGDSGKVLRRGTSCRGGGALGPAYYCGTLIDRLFSGSNQNAIIGYPHS